MKTKSKVGAGVREDARTGQHFPQVDGKDIGVSTFDPDRAQRLADESASAMSRPEIEKPAPPQPVQAATREAHTPLPWYYRPEEPSIEAEHPTETGFFCTVADCGKSRTLPPEQMKENAQLICRAVNSHAELLEALRRVMLDVENPGADILPRSKSTVSLAARQQAKEAIAKAEKGANES